MLRYFISREFFLTLLGLIGLGILTYLAIFFLILPSYTRHGDALLVPDVLEKPFAQAVQELEKEGLRIGEADSGYNASLPPGTVLAQYPKRYSRVKPNRTISLVINQTAPPLVPMPKIKDLSLYQAKSRLEGWKLSIGKVTRKPDFADNTVLEAFYEKNRIKPGTMIPQGSKIDVIVSDNQNSSKVAIPELSGYTYEDALDLLRDLGLGLGIVSYNPNGPSDMIGRVYRQSPQPGFRDSMRVGSPIDIFVYGKEPEENEGIFTEEIQDN